MLLQVVDWLLQQGVEPNTTCTRGDLQLDATLTAAVEGGHSDVARLLLTNTHARVTPTREQTIDHLQHAVLYALEGVACVLLECLLVAQVLTIADLNPSSHRDSLLAGALTLKQPGIVAALITAGAQVNPAGGELSPLALAAGTRDSEGCLPAKVLRILLQHKARTSTNLEVGNDALQVCLTWLPAVLVHTYSPSQEPAESNVAGRLHVTLSYRLV